MRTLFAVSDLVACAPTPVASPGQPSFGVARKSAHAQRNALSSHLTAAMALGLLCSTLGTGARGAEYFVSLSGKDANAGSLTQPLRTIAKGVSLLQPGDVLNLRQGVYVEPVLITAKKGTVAQPIVIRSYPGESAYIDASVPQFRTLNNNDWEPARLHDAAAHAEEYISKATFPITVDDSVNRGAFLDRNPYTRLITYSRVKDLRAAGETFDKIVTASDLRPGPQVTNSLGALLGYRHPWVYMGPGLWFDRATGKVHIRLSHTHNNVSGITDYAGEVDPRKVRLALSNKSKIALQVKGSEYIRFQKLTIRYGGEYTTHLEGVTGLMFDHVRFMGSSYVLRMGSSRDSAFHHCEFNGGMPSWYFRTDRKNEYYLNDGSGVVMNNLGKQTLRALLLGGNSDIGTEIANCEFLNAHDLYLVGTNLNFHHNWIYNLNDEGIVIDGGLTDNVKIYRNVINKTLSPISFAGTQVGGPRYIYRNLVDVRSPTAGFRPRFTGDKAVWRYGNTFKINPPDGPYDLFQNTFLVYDQEGQAAYLHFRDTTGIHRRRSLNNIFVAVNPTAGADVAMTFLPPPSFPGTSDGNDYFRMGNAVAPLLRYLTYSFGGVTYSGRNFQTLEEFRSCPPTKPLFCQSVNLEAHSISVNPQFRNMGADGVFRATDDLRLADASPALAAGVPLPTDLKPMDPFAPATGAPDMGCYPRGSAPLRVGVDQRRSFPGQ